jgi:hypothetical protein
MSSRFVFGRGQYKRYNIINSILGDDPFDDEIDLIEIQTSSSEEAADVNIFDEDCNVDKDINSDFNLDEDIDDIEKSFLFYLDGAITFQSGSTENDDSDCINFLSQSLFPGSEHTVQDVMVLIELFKAFTHIGDINESFLLGIIASVLPHNNLLARCLKKNGFTSYFFQKLINFGTILIPKCSIYKVPVCSKGCMAYVGLHKESTMCYVCNTEKPSSMKHYFYYFPIKERLLALLNSDLFKFFNYPKSRQSPSASFREDIFDGSAYKWFESQMEPNQFFIGLQFCWDGADIFNFSGKSMWPLAVSILNFPKDIRDKVNIGLHVLSLCKGTCFFCCIIALVLL